VRTEQPTSERLRPRVLASIQWKLSGLALPDAGPADLERAIFADGVSIQSARGLGTYLRFVLPMGAVRVACPRRSEPTVALTQSTLCSA